VNLSDLPLFDRALLWGVGTLVGSFVVAITLLILRAARQVARAPREITLRIEATHRHELAFSEDGERQLHGLVRRATVGVPGSEPSGVSPAVDSQVEAGKAADAQALAVGMAELRAEFATSGLGVSEDHLRTMAEQMLRGSRLEPAFANRAAEQAFEDLLYAQRTNTAPEAP
jgi:hypothetical protein